MIAQVLLELALADELVEASGPQAALVAEAIGRDPFDQTGAELIVTLVGGRLGAQQLVAHLQPTASRCKACLSSSETSSASGSSRTTDATSSGP